jgi:hypothetical protein
MYRRLKTEFNTWKDRRFTQDTGNIEICLNDNGTINMDKSEKDFGNPILLYQKLMI